MKVFTHCTLWRRRKPHPRKWNNPGIADSLLLMMTAYLQISKFHSFLVRSCGSVMVSNTSGKLPISIFRVEIHPPWRWRQQPYSKSSYTRVYAKLSGIVFQWILTSDWHYLFVANQIVSVPIKFQTRGGNRYLERCILMSIPDDGKEDTKKATSRKTLLWCWFSHVRCPVLLVGAINSNSSLTTNAAHAHLSHH